MPQWRYDHYELCATAEGMPLELGRGAMGITYQALDTRLGRTVALKVINPRHLSGESSRERFLREARSASLLRDANVASIYHLGLEDGKCFYAMEYIDGETLEDRVRREGALAWETALEIIAQAAHALKTAHRQHLIHRDIKPTNLMLARGDGSEHRETVLKVIDFGLVKTVTPEGVGAAAFHQSYFAGTPHFASPEQVAGGEIDARSDIFSLGVCLRFMLMGGVPQGPPDGSQSGQEPRNSLATAETWTGKVPRPVVSLLHRMVASDPAARPQTASELLVQIQQCWKSIRQPSGGTGRKLVWGVGILGAALFAAFLFRSSLAGLVSPKYPSAVVTAAPVSLDARVLYARGNELASKLTKQDNEEAIRLYSKAIEQSPAFADAHASLAFACLQAFCRYNAPSKELDAALDHAQRAIALAPNSPSGFTALGDIRTIQGLHWIALAQYRHALELNPRHVAAMRGFSHLWTAVGQPQCGLPWAIAAAELAPSETSNWSAAADASVDLCADDKAESFYHRCLQIRPTWMSAHCGLLHIHLLQGDFGQARRDVETIDSINPDLMLPLTLKAQVALFSGEYARAEELYLRLLAMKREGLVHYYGSISYLSALGFLRARAGDAVQANAFLAEAEALQTKESEGPQTIYDLAAIRAIQGQTDQALALLRQAVASGWLDYRAMRLDPRFGSLRNQASFEGLLKTLSIQVEAMRKESDVLCSKPLILADYPVLAQDN